MESVAIVQDGPGSDPQAVLLPNPISTEVPVDDGDPEAGDQPEARPLKGPPEKKLSVRETLEKNARKVDAKEAEAARPEGDKTLAAVKDKPAVDAATRDANGKFLAKTPEVDPKAVVAEKPGTGKETATAQPAKVEVAAKPPAIAAPDAPERFSADAKAAWATAPESVKAEVHRALRELDQGIAKYKPDAESFKPFKEFHDLAKSLNVDPARALKEYVSLDRMLGENFPQAMARICQNKRVDIRAFAADVLQLTPESRAALKIGSGQPQAQPVSPEVLALRQEVAGLKQQITGVAGSVQQHQETTKQSQEAAAAREIADFTATNPPLFEELSEKIAAHIANDGLSLRDAHAKALSEFQAMAERAGLIPRAPTPAVPEVADPVAAQTLLKGQKSITGAPGAGSAPAAKKRSSSIREALEANFNSLV